MGGKAAAGISDLPGDLHHDVRLHTAFLLGKFGSVARVVTLQCFDRGIEIVPVGFEAVYFQLLPVGPVPHERGIVAVLVKDDFGHREKDGGLRARISWHPVVRHASDDAVFRA